MPVAATVVAGHGIASGSAGDMRFPRGTIAEQLAHFRERGVDLATLLGAPPAMGTINVDLTPVVPVIIRPEITLCHVTWSDKMPPENFWFFKATLWTKGGRYPAVVYMPDPDTKPEHHQPRNVVELIAQPIQGIAPGVRVTLSVDPRFIRCERHWPSRDPNPQPI